MNGVAFSILGISLIAQGSLFSFPLVFVFLQNLAVKQKSEWIFAVAFVLGIILDLLYLNPIGGTSLFFLLFLFAVFTYEKKFEIDNLTFIFISSFLGAMLLLSIMGETAVLLKAFLTSIFAILISKLPW